MLHLILVIGLVLLAVAVTMVTRALMIPSGRSEMLDQIGAYGFAGTLRSGDTQARRGLRSRFDALSGALGTSLNRRFSRLKGRDLRSRLISAGMYDTTPERLTGNQFLLAVGSVFAWLLLAGLGGVATWLIVVGAIFAGAAGWVLPSFLVDRRARTRRDRIEKDLPDLIDLLVVMLEAGLSFPQSLRLAATKIKEPLASEVRLTLQEQNMGLTLAEALEHFYERVDAPGVRMFSRSIAQGETLGVSTGQIMRNLAVELRKRRKAYAEERAQKAPVKILFPLLFLIMPALFIVLLLPVMIRILDVL